MQQNTFSFSKTNKKQQRPPKATVFSAIFFLAPKKTYIGFLCVTFPEKPGEPIETLLRTSFLIKLKKSAFSSKLLLWQCKYTADKWQKWGDSTKHTRQHWKHGVDGQEATWPCKWLGTRTASQMIGTGSRTDTAPRRDETNRRYHDTIEHAGVRVASSLHIFFCTKKK